MALANIKAPGKRIAAPEIPQNRPGCGWRPAPPKTYVFRFRGSGCGVVKSFLGGRAAAPPLMYIIMGSAANKTAHCPRFCTAAAHKTRGELSLRVLGNARAVRPIICFYQKPRLHRHPQVGWPGFPLRVWPLAVRRHTSRMPLAPPPFFHNPGTKG